MPKVVKYILIAIVGLFAIVFIVPFMIGLLSTVNPKKSIEKAERMANQSELASISENSYVFYYPKSYTKGSLEDKEVQKFENPNTKAVEPESIFLRIEPSNRKMPNPTYESCSKVSESFRQKAEDEIKAEVAYGGFGDGKGVGCKIIVKMPVAGVNDSVMIIEKTLWDDKGTDNSIYRVRALYYSNASKDEAGILNLAVDNFALK